MDEADALRRQHADLAALLERLTPADWTRPTRCEGWDVADVVLHLAQSDELAIGSVRGRFAGVASAFMRGETGGQTIDDAVDTMVRVERGEHTHDELRRRWSATANELDSTFTSADPHARVVWATGELSVRTLAATRLAENWIHTGDVADALGVALELVDDRLRHVLRLAWRTLPYAFGRAGRTQHGQVAFDVAGPSGESWYFGPDPGEPPASTTITGDGIDLCLVAARRVDPAATSLRGDGPDTDAVLELVRTYA